MTRFRRARRRVAEWVAGAAFWFILEWVGQRWRGNFWHVLFPVCSGLLTLAAAVILNGWTLARREELRAIHSDSLRQSVAATVFASFRPSGRTALMVVVLPIALYASLDSMLSFVTVSVPAEMALALAVSPAVVCFIRRIVHRDLQHFIWRILAHRGVLICIHCGYDLRGQTTWRCPECGKPFDPRRLSLPEGTLYAVDCWRPQEQPGTSRAER